jgi:hypothetical protein
VPGVAVAALVDGDAQHAQCSDCDPTCFRVGDNFDPSAGALEAPFAEGVQYHSSGAGLTLVSSLPLPVSMPPDMLPDGTLYLHLPIGLTASAIHAGRVRPPQSDVYLLLDQSLAMAQPTQWVQDLFDAGSLLPAGTPCGDGDASLLDQGISGALRCKIPDTELGVGMFRDIPFAPYARDAALPAGEREADARRELAYRNHARQTADHAAVAAALGTLGGVESAGDPDVAASQIPALHSVATGDGLFAGIGRAPVPAASACSDERFGYPCFREDSRPVVVLVTSSPFHQGPDPASYPYDYDPADLAMQIGTVPGATSIGVSNDDFGSAYALPGDAGSSLALYEGSTEALGADVDASLVGCGADALAPDALFRFHVDAPAGATVPVTLSTEGSAFPTVLAVLAQGASGVETLPAASGNELFTAPSAHVIGDVTYRQVLVDGDTTAPDDLGADYQGSLFGQMCGASSLAPDRVHRFDLSTATEETDISVQLTMPGQRAVLSIHEEGAGPLPQWPARTTPMLATGNDDASAANVFPIPGGDDDDYLTVRGDSTGMNADYDIAALGFTACAPALGGADVAFRIDVSGTAVRTLRFDTEGSSFDTVLSLHDGPPVPTGLGMPVACDDDGAVDGGASALEITLQPGDYYLVLKAKQAGDAGPYQLTVRDMDDVPMNEHVCDASDAAGETATVVFPAQPGRSYYALVKGDTPDDKGPYALRVRDEGALEQALGCDASSAPDGNSQLTVALGTGDYYAVIKGRSAAQAGQYRLSIGGAAPIESVFEPPGYGQTIAALQASDIHVAAVVSCDPGESCEHAAAQAEQLADETDGALRVAEGPQQVPAEIVRAVQLVEAFDSVRAELRFEPDPNPGFAFARVTAVPDPNNLCSPGADAASFRECAPGAIPAFRVSLRNPALMPVPPAAGDGYAFTLRVTGERDGQVILQQDVPVLADPAAGAEPGSYDHGSYHQDLDANGCGAITERPSWDELSFDADVLPDTTVTFYACTAEESEGLEMCDDGAPSSGYQRVLTISAGSGVGTPCSVAADCPGGHCSPYSGVCNELEGASCTMDDDCPGTAAGRCRAGASAAQLGNTCRVDNLTAGPASALRLGNHRPFMRLRVDLDSQGDGSRTPAVFFWEARYHCRSEL